MTNKKANFDLSIHLDDLADLFPNGALQAATDPAQFIRDVIAEIKRLRKWIGRVMDMVQEAEREVILGDMEVAAQAVIDLFGPVKKGSDVDVLKTALDGFRDWKVRFDGLADD